ncbi:MAG: hypothetical protein RSC08_02885 [Oscillospiraceae bacterium]
MVYTLKNEKLTVSISSLGGEIVALDGGAGYDKGCIWDASPAWPRHAPVCFPWCGRLENGYFMEDGRRYEGGVHGFLRDLEHTLVEQGEDFIRLRGVWQGDERVFPWSFSCDTEHRLEGESVVTTLTATNTGKVPMPAQIGFHSALRCPFTADKKPTDYRFRFEKPEAPDGTDALPITEGMFDSDSICFENLASNWVQVEEKEKGRYLRVSTERVPYVLLWTKPELPGFVCIEPWLGYPGPGESLWTRPGSVTLAPGEALRHTQRLTVDTSKK